MAIRVPVTDPDSIIAPNKEGGYAPNCTPVVAVEKNSGAIVLCEVVEGSDEAAAVKPAMEAAREVLGKKPDRILADTSFAAGENLAYIGPVGLFFREGGLGFARHGANVERRKQV